VRRYRTEIHIPADRYIALQLPEHVPEGRAIITVLIPDPEPDDHAHGASELDLDHHDVEWWEEFDGPEEAEEAPEGSGGA
jgi:hypothetical protein